MLAVVVNGLFVWLAGLAFGFGVYWCCGLGLGVGWADVLTCFVLYAGSLIVDGYFVLGGLILVSLFG